MLLGLLEWMNPIASVYFKTLDPTELDTVLFCNFFFLLAEEAEPEDSGDYWQIKVSRESPPPKRASYK